MDPDQAASPAATLVNTISVGPNPIAVLTTPLTVPCALKPGNVQEPLVYVPVLPIVSMIVNRDGSHPVRVAQIDAPSIVLEQTPRQDADVMNTSANTAIIAALGSLVSVPRMYFSLELRCCGRIFPVNPDHSSRHNTPTDDAC